MSKSRRRPPRRLVPLAQHPTVDATPGRAPRPTWRRRLSRTLLAAIGLLVLTLIGFRVAAALRERHAPEAIAPATGRFVDTGHGRLFVQDEGPRDGRPVLLIHGTAAWSEFWRGTIDHLTARGFRVVAIDLPPFGFSDRSMLADYSRATQAARIAGALAALDLRRVTLVGHSFGAGATLEAVMRHPERIAGLVLVAAALGLAEEGRSPAPPSTLLQALLVADTLPELLVAATATNPWATRSLLATMVARKDAATPALAEVLRRPMTLERTTPDFVRWLRGFLTPEPGAASNSPAAYARLRTPTRIVWGDLDTLTPLPQGERLARLIPDARLSLMRGVGHIPQIEDPAAFRPLLTNLLEELSPR
jgi:pimeloyl-ACP methyl ester carboxylesterase